MSKMSRRKMLGTVGASPVAAAAVSRQMMANSASATSPTYKLVREIPVEEGYDLVVAGGGPAGVAVATCDARLGAKVLLVEATGCLGGMGTSGLVTSFAPNADGEKMLVRGLMQEVIKTLYRRGFMPPDTHPDSWRKTHHVWVPFNPEGYKIVLDELVTKAGVEVCFFTQVIDVHADRERGTVDGVVLHNIEGYRYVRAKTFLDGTGDAVLAEMCGVTCRAAGHDTPGIMPPTLCSLCSGIDFTRFHDEPTFRPHRSQQDAVEQAVKDQFFTQPDLHLPGLFRTGASTASMNAGHLFNLDALRCKNLTDGVMLGRRIAQEYVAFYRKYVPGCEKLEHAVTAPLVGIRESRRILGEYELTVNDYQARRQFPNQIAVYAMAIHIHVYAATSDEYLRHRREMDGSRYHVGEFYGIPYGVLVPKGWKNLWVAGRCISTDVKMHGSTRTQPAAIAMGQAVGAAAVQSIRRRCDAGEVDTEQLVNTLRQAGAFLPQTTTTKTMTRG